MEGKGNNERWVLEGGKYRSPGSDVLSVLKPAQRFRMANLRHEQKPVHNDYWSLPIKAYH